MCADGNYPLSCTECPHAPHSGLCTDTSQTQRKLLGALLQAAKPRWRLPTLSELSTQTTPKNCNLNIAVLRVLQQLQHVGSYHMH